MPPRSQPQPAQPRARAASGKLARSASAPVLAPTPDRPPARLLRAQKSRIPSGYAGELEGRRSYQETFSIKVWNRLLEHGIKPPAALPAHLLPAPGTPTAERSRRVLELFKTKFRVSVVSLGGTLMARTSHLARGQFGKHHIAMGDDGKLVAIKTLRVGSFGQEETPPASPTLARGASPEAPQAVSIDEAVREATMLQRFFSPDTAAGIDPHSGKMLITMPLAVEVGSDVSKMARTVTARADDPADGAALLRALVRSTARQVTEQLVIMHDANLVHGDIKPANIFLLANGIVKAGDLGACATPADTFAPGTLLYGPPELMSAAAPGQPVTTNADVWPLGLALAEMLVASHDPLSAYRHSSIGPYHLQNDLLAWQASVCPGGRLSPAALADDHGLADVAGYFRAVYDRDPELATIIIERMLVDAQDRSDSRELAAAFADLQPKTSAAEQLVHQHLRERAERPQLRAIRVALQLRLDDEHEANSSQGTATP